jgi:hypothetical protein
MALPKKQKELEGTQGWAEFITNKNAMLNAYDKAKERSQNKRIKVDPGKVAEAKFREWLASFLPKKYGVTSGYIICQSFKDTIKQKHFDVIIYDQINSPVLWTEENADSSGQGSSRAIPAEYTHGVFEIKSSLNKKSCAEAIKKLDELEPLLTGVDDESKYKKYLPKNFAMGVIFFELTKKNENDLSVLEVLKPKTFYRGFLNALVLRGEGLKSLNSARMLLLGGETELDNKKSSNSLLVHPTPYGFVAKEDDTFLYNLLYWSPAMFAMYAFDIIAMMDGKYDPSGRASTFHGFVYNKED